MPKPFLLFFLLLLTTMFGFGIELYQLNCVEGRSFDYWDGIADTIGGIIGWLIVKKWKE